MFPEILPWLWIVQFSGNLYPMKVIWTNQLLIKCFGSVTVSISKNNGFRLEFYFMAKVWVLRFFQFSIPTVIALFQSRLMCSARSPELNLTGAHVGTGSYLSRTLIIIFVQYTLRTWWLQVLNIRHETFERVLWALSPAHPR